MEPPWGWAPEAVRGKAACNRRGAGPRMPLGAGPRAIAVGLGPKSRCRRGPVQAPCNWAPEANGARALEAVGDRALGAVGGRVLCNRRGAEPQKPLGAGPRAIAVGLSPRSRWGHGPVQSPWRWAPEAVEESAPCKHRGARPQMPLGAGPCAITMGLGPRSRWGLAAAAGA